MLRPLKHNFDELWCLLLTNPLRQTLLFQNIFIYIHMAAICPLIVLWSMRGEDKNLLSQALFYPSLLYSILPYNLTFWQLSFCFLPLALFPLLLLYPSAHQQEGPPIGAWSYLSLLPVKMEFLFGVRLLKAPKNLTRIIGDILVEKLCSWVWDDTQIKKVWVTEERQRQPNTENIFCTLHSRWKHLQSLPLPKRNNINNEKEAAKTEFSSFFSTCADHLTTKHITFLIWKKIKRSSLLLYSFFFLAFMCEREREKKHANSKCFQGKKVWMEALFFSALSCSFWRLHKAQGCWSLSYFCGFWSDSMFHWSSFPPLSCLIYAADTCTACTYAHNTVTHSISQPRHRTNSRTFCPRVQTLGLVFPNTAGFTVSLRPRWENWLLIKRSQRKLSVSITTKAGWLPTFSCTPS